jgi:hypothetical protein
MPQWAAEAKKEKEKQKYEIGSPKTMLPRSCASLHMFWDGISPF